MVCAAFGAIILNISKDKDQSSLISFLQEVTDENGLGILHIAALSSDTETLMPMLLQLGLDCNSLDEQGRTPLHLFSAMGRLYGVSSLLAFGAKVNAKALSDGSTPLHFASHNGNDEVVKMLLAYGALAGIKNAAGHTAAEVNRSGMHL